MPERPPADPRASGILAAFDDHVSSGSVPLHYRLGLILVAGAMVLLPLVYLGLIALTAYWTVLYCSHLGEVTEGTRGSSVLVMIFGPPLIGFTVVVFMIKPLFAPRGKGRRPRELRRLAEPLLFTFVERICRAVRAPVPRTIVVDHEVNASASFRRGMISMFGSDLQLCIGLPLAGGLTLRQFAGVLAHEFGHFAQSGGMRLTYVIRTVSAWFARVVYERDSWDEHLEAWAKGIDIRIGIILHLARLMVWLTRRILWALMWAGHLISCYMLRQMEFDADRHETFMAGSKTFAETSMRLAVLGVAASKTQSDLTSSWNEGRLVDDYPGMIVANSGTLPKDVLTEIGRQSARQRTGILDTHPSNAQRVARAAQLNLPGLFHPEEGLKATTLFSDFKGLCRSVSLELYKEVFSPKIERNILVPTEDLERRENAEREAGDAFRRFFQADVSPLRPLQLPRQCQAPTIDREAAVAALRAARDRMLKARSSYAVAFKRWIELDTRQLQVTQAVALVDAGFKLNPKELRLSSADKPSLRAESSSVRMKTESVNPSLASFEAEAAARLATVLGLLDHPTVAAGIPDAQELAKQAKAMVPSAMSLAQSTPTAVEMRDEVHALMVLLQNVEANQGNELLFNEIRSKSNILRKKLTLLRECLGLMPYPLDHADKQMTLRGFIIPSIPRDEEIGKVVQAGNEGVDRFFTLSARLTARLAQIAERVEDALGLERLPDPARAK